MEKIKEYTASEITAIAIYDLKRLGYNVWRNNNLAVKGRAFIGKRGVADIIGITKQGLHVECEVKKCGDKLSKVQIEHLTMITDCGGLTFIAHQENKKILLTPFLDYFLKYVLV
jgi:hypothetical protein